MRLKRVVLDENLAPHARQQFILGDKMPTAFRQGKQNIERIASEVDRGLRLQQPALRGLELEAPEPIVHGGPCVAHRVVLNLEDSPRVYAEDLDRQALEIHRGQCVCSRPRSDATLGPACESMPSKKTPTERSEPAGSPPAGLAQRLERSDLNAARSPAADRSGGSHIAKCQPRNGNSTSARVVAAASGKSCRSQVIGR
jgi:hypothetical protein